MQAVHGDNVLTGVTYVNNETGETTTEETPAMFLFIGAKPHTDLVKDVVALSDAGFVLTGSDLAPPGKRPGGLAARETAVRDGDQYPGHFRGGRCPHGVVRRVASAVGQGSAVVSFVHEYLKTV